MAIDPQNRGHNIRIHFTPGSFQNGFVKNSNFEWRQRPKLTALRIAQVYFPLIMAKPWLVIYFMPILLFLSIALMNLAAWHGGMFSGHVLGEWKP